MSTLRLCISPTTLVASIAFIAFIATTVGVRIIEKRVWTIMTIIGINRSLRTLVCPAAYRAYRVSLGSTIYGTCERCSHRVPIILPVVAPAPLPGDFFRTALPPLRWFPSHR